MHFSLIFLLIKKSIKVRDGVCNEVMVHISMYNGVKNRLTSRTEVHGAHQHVQGGLDRSRMHEILGQLLLEKKKGMLDTRSLLSVHEKLGKPVLPNIFFNGFGFTKEVAPLAKLQPKPFYEKLEPYQTGLGNFSGYLAATYIIDIIF